MPRVCVIDLPGLSKDLLQFIPPTTALGRWIATQHVASLKPSWPAVTCSVQATLTTGQPPARHGIVANGIATIRSGADASLTDPANFTDYRRQISFWEQSNQFLDVPRFWQNSAGESRYKTALLFFQNSMPGFSEPRRPAADIVLTPKPDHGPDGKLTSLCWSSPPELVPALFKELGPFPLMNYWGPMASIPSSAWIAKAAARVWEEHRPQLQLVYVPHLDYDLQRFGPDSPQAHKAVADVAAAVEPLVSAVLAEGATLFLLSEYAMEPVNHCTMPNVLLRRAGLLRTRPSADGELIDYERSTAWVMADHQIGHLYLRSESDGTVAREALSSAPLSIHARKDLLPHRRAGDLLLESDPGGWLSYQWWESPEDAPTFARAVDIHRKPGYDPLELFFDPKAKAIATDPALVRGSHGRGGGTPGVWISSAGPNEIGAEMVSAPIRDALES